MSWGEQVEGVRAVEHALAAGRRHIDELHISSTEGPGRGRIIEQAATLGVRVIESTTDEISRLAKGAVPQGVIALGERLPEVSIGEATDRAAACRGFIVGCDGIQDPGNLGAILRSAAALGATGVLIARHGGASLTAATMKAAAGAAEYLDLVPIASMTKALAVTSAAGLWTVVLEAGGDPIYGHPLLSEPLVLVVGGENKGVGRLVRERADLIASIPMVGAIESLNASVTVAAACSEIQRNRCGTDRQ